jgi:RNA polymerase sigma-70 factor (ECF subfamily)
MTSTGTTDNTRYTDAWHVNHSYLVDLAFGMVGNIATAEDSVQEAFTRLAKTDLNDIEEVRGWLIVVTTRICLDHIRAASSRLEQPVEATAMESTSPARGGGPLGSGAATGAGLVGGGSTPPDPADRVTLDDEVRLALLVVLQRLTPIERVVFVLHDIFGTPFDAVAATVGRPAATCRQLARRARIKVQASDGGRRGSPPVDRAEHQEVAEQFIRACANGDLRGLLEILDPDVWGDVDFGPMDQRTGRVNRGADIVGGTLLHHFGPMTMVSNPVGAHTIVLAFADQKLYAIALLTIEARLVRQIHVLADPARLAELDAELLAGPASPSS